MSTKPSQLDSFAIGTPVPTIPMRLRILAIVLRALFIGALVAGASLVREKSRQFVPYSDAARWPTSAQNAC
jgi:hypothetical protein